MANAFFSDLLSTISERGRTLLRRGEPSVARQDASELLELCKALLSGRGEASGTAMAREVLDRYHDLDAAGRLTFFETLARDFGPDREKLSQAIESWRSQPNDSDASDLHFASEPQRQELIRRLNRAPGGTSDLVAMRADLLALMKGNKDLAALDRDVVHLLSSWFNRGFLVLRRIDWSTPANILEQIIRYEAVHEIRDWNDLRRRIDPVDRRCYAFFHPQLNDEPLIFVEVALTETIPTAIAPLLAAERQLVPIERARTAVFYSISNTQKGTWRHFLRQFPDQAGGRGIAARTAEARHVHHAVAGAGLHAMAEAGRRRSGQRRGTDAAGKSRQARLVRECGTDRAIARRGRAAGGALFPQSPHAEGPADRFGGALPYRQRRAAGEDRLARRPLAQGPARIRRRHGQLSLPAGRHREEPRGLRQPGRHRRFQRGEENAQDRGPAATGYAAVVERRVEFIRRPTGNHDCNGRWRHTSPADKPRRADRRHRRVAGHGPARRRRDERRDGISRFDLRAVSLPQASFIADRQRRRNDPDAGRRSEGACAVFAAVRRRPCHPVRAACEERAPHGAARAPARRVAGVRAHPPLPDLERRYSHRICARWIHRPAVPVRSALAIGCRRAGVSRVVPCDAGLSAAGIVARHGRAGAGCRRGASHLSDGRLPRRAGVPAPRDSPFRCPARLYLSAHDRVVSSRRVRLAHRHSAKPATPSAVLDRRRLYRPWRGIDPLPMPAA